MATIVATACKASPYKTPKEPLTACLRCRSSSSEPSPARPSCSGFRSAGSRARASRLRAALSATATGILLFLLYDVIHGGIEPVDEALEGAVDGGSWAHFLGFAVLFGAGVTAGLMSLVYYDRWLKSKRDRAMLGPGAASAAEFEGSWAASLSAASWLSILIATGIGLHNFSEGLAIGQAGASGEISLAVVLIVGFGLHNATEGFGIVAPLSGDPVRPSWKFLGLLGLIGGGADLRRDADRPGVGRARSSRSCSSRSPRARSSTSCSSWRT